jgi:hypothetical protein
VLSALARPGQDGHLTIADDTRMNLQYFRHVRAGATRIGAGTSAPGWFDPAAFLNTDGRQVVVVKARAAGDLTITGLKPGPYAFSYATEEQSVIDTRPHDVSGNGAVMLTMPGRGVATLAALPVPD